MRKTVINRIAAAAIASALILVNCMGIMAAEMETDGTIEVDGVNTITLKKEIVLYNTENATINLPNITYNYTIAPTDVATPTVTDSAGNKATVNDGVAGGVTLTDSTAVFANTSTHATKDDGSEKAVDTIEATVDISKFTKAGIFRYTITETDNTTDLENAGITRPSTYKNVRYLDVYIGNVDSTTRKVIGYVCMVANSDANENIDGKTTADTQNFAKSAGFVDTFDNTVGTATETTGYADKYYTYNVTVTKNIEGALADKSHKFPFEINTSGAVTNQPFSITTTGEAVSFASAADGAAAGSKQGKIGTAVTVNLDDAKQIKLIGLPANTTLTKVEETNDTPDVYKAKIALNDGTPGEETDVEANVGKKGVDVSTPVAITNYASDKTVAPTGNVQSYTFTNTLAQVSPTGLMFRYAPYILMIVVALMMMAVYRRREEAL